MVANKQRREEDERHRQRVAHINAMYEQHRPAETHVPIIKEEASYQVQGPADGSHHPPPHTVCTPRPVGGFVCPVKGFVCPVEGSDRPVEGSVRPVEGFDRPVEGFVCPVEGSYRPVEGPSRPVEGPSRPVEGSAPTFLAVWGSSVAKTAAVVSGPGGHLASDTAAVAALTSGQSGGRKERKHHMSHQKATLAQQHISGSGFDSHSTESPFLSRPGRGRFGALNLPQQHQTGAAPQGPNTRHQQHRRPSTFPKASDACQQFQTALGTDRCSSVQHAQRPAASGIYTMPLLTTNETTAGQDPVSLSLSKLPSHFYSAGASILMWMPPVVPLGSCRWCP